MRWLALGCLLLVPLGSAQVPDTLALYPHFESSAGRWLSVVADEPSATQASSGGNPLIHPLGPASGYMPLEYWWLYPYVPADGAGAIVVDTTRTVDVQLEVIVYLTYGTTAPTPALVDVSWELRSGNGVVAAGPPQSIGPTPGTTPTKLTWSETPALAAVDDPTTVQLYVLMEGPAANYWIVTEREDASYVHLPVLVAPEPVAANVVNETLLDALPVVEHAFDAATNDTYLFNWTSALDAFTWDYQATVEAGNVSIALLDPTGTVADEILVNASSGGLLEGTGNGTWAIEVRYHAFQGTLRLAAQEVPAPLTEETPILGTQNETVDEETGTKEAPAAALVLPLLLAAAGRRRR